MLRRLLWTCSAMGGSVKFEDALAKRLGIMNCSRAALDNFLATKPPRISPGITPLTPILLSLLFLRALACCTAPGAQQKPSWWTIVRMARGPDLCVVQKPGFTAACSSCEVQGLRQPVPLVKSRVYAWLCLR
jgi:hypothetical protein